MRTSERGAAFGSHTSHFGGSGGACASGRAFTSLAASFAASLDDVLRWQRHTTYILDDRVCPLTVDELERWATAPSVLVHVPRTSGTTLRALYASVLNETQLTQARHYSAAQMRACATAAWDKKRSVAIIRDPWARAVSAYDHLVNVSYSA